MLNTWQNTFQLFRVFFWLFKKQQAIHRHVLLLKLDSRIWVAEVDNLLELLHLSIYGPSIERYVLFVLPLKFVFFEITGPSGVPLHAVTVFCFGFPLAKHVSIGKSNYILANRIVPPHTWMFQIKSSVTLFKEVVADSCPKLHLLWKLWMLHHFDYLIIPYIDLKWVIIYFPVWISLQIDVFSNNGPELHFSLVEIVVKGSVEVNWFGSFDHFPCKTFFQKRLELRFNVKVATLCFAAK